MDADTLEALRASIRHWEANATAEHNWSAAIGAQDCPLCQKFLAANPGGYCAGCPVAIRANQPGCTGTPYVAARQAYTSWYHARKDEATSARNAFHTAVQAEIEFLKSLLPSPETINEP
jgi:hypothetical protein